MMRVTILSLLFAVVSATQTTAQSSGLTELATGDQARGWEAVGRIDIDGKGFCTGALIEPDIVLTAAHCVHDADGALISESRMEFLAGLRGGRPEAFRTVRKVVFHPEYVHADENDPQPEQVRYDLALLQLDRPIRSSRVVPFEISSTMSQGTEVGVVSYAMDREDAPSLQETCNVLGQQEGVLVMDCSVNFGASGAPIFRNENGVPRLVSVVSAMAEMDGKQISLGTDLAAPMAVLRSALAAEQGVFQTPPSTARVIRPGQRNDTGALFVRPE